MKCRLFVASAIVCVGCAGQPAESPASDTQQARSSNLSITSKSPDAIARLQKGEMLLDNLRTDEALRNSRPHYSWIRTSCSRVPTLASLAAEP